MVSLKQPADPEAEKETATLGADELDALLAESNTPPPAPLGEEDTTSNMPGPEIDRLLVEARSTLAFDSSEANTRPTLVPKKPFLPEEMKETKPMRALKIPRAALPSMPAPEVPDATSSPVEPRGPVSSSGEIAYAL